MKSITPQALNPETMSPEAVKAIKEYKESEANQGQKGTSVPANQAPQRGSNEPKEGGKTPGKTDTNGSKGKTPTQSKKPKSKPKQKASNTVVSKEVVVPMVRYDSKEKSLTLCEQTILKGNVYVRTVAQVSLGGLDEQTIQVVISVAKLTMGFSKLQDVLLKPEIDIVSPDGTKSKKLGSSSLDKLNAAIERLKAPKTKQEPETGNGPIAGV